MRDGAVIEAWQCELVEPSHPVLHSTATVNPFGTGIDWDAREKEMFELMHLKLGIGLAATQIGSRHNMFVMQHRELGDIGIYNPMVLETSGAVMITEGCLSWPMLYLSINRPASIKVSWTKNDGVTNVEMRMDGIDARCFLHEVDHLKGINFIDGVSEFQLKRAKEKREKILKKISRVSKK